MQFIGGLGFKDLTAEWAFEDDSRDSHPNTLTLSNVLSLGKRLPQQIVLSAVSARNFAE
jgi:hypothetical protein